MRVLVTGGAGYVGSVVVQQLVRAGFQVSVLDNLVQGNRQAVDPGARFVEGDIGDGDLVRGLLTSHGVEAVVHMAAATVIERSQRDPRFFYEENVVKGLALVHAMLDCGVKKLVFSSTAAVYGEPLTDPITESHPQAPINVYGRTKLMLENALASYHQAYQLNYTAFRYFNASGASQPLGEDHRPETHLIPLLFRAASAGAASAGAAPLKVFGRDYDTPDGTCVRDYVHVLDLAQAHRLALEQIDDVKAASFNLGAGVGRSVQELIDAAEKVTGARIPVETAPRRPGDPSRLVASPEQAMKRLGWEPKHSDLETILSSAWEWFQQHPQGWDDQPANQ